MPRTSKTEEAPAQPIADSFESLFAALEDRARRLEVGNLPLDDSLRIAEEAAVFAEKLRAILNAAELRVTDLRSRLRPQVVGSQFDENEASYEFDEVEE